MAQKKLYNTKDIGKKKQLNPDQVAEVKGWMQTVLSKEYTDFFQDIRDGVELCILVNTIKPGTIPAKKFKKSQIAFVARTNIQLFIEGCKKLGVPQSDCFETRDLFDQQDLNRVVLNLYAVSAISRKHGFGGPFVGLKYAQKNKRNFTQEQLNKSKSAVPSWNKGSNYNATKNQDGYGIIKTDKNMQTHSGVQSTWEKGAKAVNKSNIDGYGIVKTDKDMQKPSQVQGAWQKGAKQVNNSNMDGYGIVKTDKDMQNHSGVQSVWEKGAKKNETSNIDGYGIVKTDKDMQKPSQAQGAWQQGAKEVNTQNQDSYGIIKTTD